MFKGHVKRVERQAEDWEEIFISILYLIKDFFPKYTLDNKIVNPYSRFALVDHPSRNRWLDSWIHECNTQVRDQS